MRRSLTWLLAGLLGGALLSGTAVAAAHDVADSCTAVSLHYVIGGSAQAPQVAGGGPAGFICAGASYVPLRWLARTLGQTVAWDGSTYTITLTAPAGAVPTSTSTKLVVYTPVAFTAEQTVSGDCWTGSIAAPRAGAYRCMAGNAIFDPCFVGTAPNTADCPDPTADPDLQTGTVIQLTHALPAAATAPQPDPSRPWRFQLANGAVCGAMTGTVVAPDHPYGCAPVATGSASATGGGVLYCTGPAKNPTGTGYTASCGPLSSQRAANGAPELASPATYGIAEMWL